MAVDPLSSAWSKYHWASKHMKSVDAAMGRSFVPELHSVVFDLKIKDEGRNATATVVIAKLPIIRTELGLALGDVVHNFRSALDHLAWGLVKAGADPKPKKPRGVYFPMADNGGDFKDRVDGWLPGVCDEYRTVIRRYQPFGRGNRAKAIRWLNKTSNVDKHRVLIPAVVNHSRIECRVTSNWSITSWERLVKRPRALHVGTPVVKVGLARGVVSECKMQVQGGAAIHPSLGYGVPVAGALDLIRATVFEILETFDSLL